MVNKIKDLVSKAFNWYGELTGLKKLYVTIIGVVIIAFLVMAISNINLDKKIINYKEINTDSIMALEVNNDKDIYIMCDTAIKRMILTHYGNYKLGSEKIDYNDLYEFSKDWEYSISKSKFKKKIGKIVTELQSERNASLNNMETFYPVVKNIYTYSVENKMYFIEFATKERHILGLHFIKGRFYVFYVE